MNEYLKEFYKGHYDLFIESMFGIELRPWQKLYIRYLYRLKYKIPDMVHTIIFRNGSEIKTLRECDCSRGLRSKYIEFYEFED